MREPQENNSGENKLPREFSHRTSTRSDSWIRYFNDTSYEACRGCVRHCRTTPMRYRVMRKVSPCFRPPVPSRKRSSKCLSNSMTTSPKCRNNSWIYSFLPEAKANEVFLHRKNPFSPSNWEVRERRNLMKGVISRMNLDCIVLPCRSHSGAIARPSIPQASRLFCDWDSLAQHYDGRKCRRWCWYVLSYVYRVAHI